MILSFHDKRTRRIFQRESVSGISAPLQRAALRKLLILDAAGTLQDLMVPPGNRLEKLHGNRTGKYSIRINNQWRICFHWSESGAEDVEMTDYH